MLACILFALIVPKYLNEAASQSFKQVTLSFLIGFAFLTLAPLLAIILMVTVIGALAGIILLAVWAIVGLLSGIFAAYYAGKLLLQNQATNVLFTVAVGALIVGLVMMVPLINILAFVFIVFTGAGMQITQLKNQFSKQPYRL